MNYCQVTVELTLANDTLDSRLEAAGGMDMHVTCSGDMDDLLSALNEKLGIPEDGEEPQIVQEDLTVVGISADDSEWEEVIDQVRTKAMNDLEFALEVADACDDLTGEDDVLGLLYCLTQLNYAFSAAVSKAADVQFSFETAENYAMELVEGQFKIPSILQNHIDWRAVFNNELVPDGDVVEWDDSPRGCVLVLSNSQL